MLAEVTVAAGIAAFAMHWLIPAVRKRVEFEIELGAAVTCLWVSAYTLWVWGQAPPLVTTPGWVKASGLTLCLVSIVVSVVAAVSLRARGEPERGWEDTTVLWTGGLHGLVRHPMQLGVVLAAVGIALMRPTAPVLALCAPSALLAVRAAFAEDTYDVRKFGDSYREYMQAVPRLNPAVGLLRKIARARPTTGGGR